LEDAVVLLAGVSISGCGGTEAAGLSGFLKSDLLLFRKNRIQAMIKVARSKPIIKLTSPLPA